MLRRIVGVCLALLGFGRAAAAQAGNPVEGGPEFIMPLGARAMGLGQAVVASASGGEAVWWNPALIARSPREFSMGAVSGIFPAEGDISLVGVYSLPRVISLALSARYVDQGTTESTLDVTGQVVGSFHTSVYVVGATFAAPFGNRVAVGTTLKLLTVNFDCTGTCPNQPQNNPVTGAVDVGAQYIATKDSLVTFAVAVRNIGSRLQFNDAPQADPLPGRIDAGLEFAPRLKQYPGLGLRVSGSVVTRLESASGPGARFGTELSWLNLYFARVGYVARGPTGSGPSFGGGLARGRWRIDFAEFLSDNTVGTGARPTYFSLRYLF